MPEIPPAPLAPDHSGVFGTEKKHRTQKQEVPAPKENMISEWFAPACQPETDEVCGGEKNSCKSKLSETVKQDNPNECVIGPIKGWLFGKE